MGKKYPAGRHGVRVLARKILFRNNVLIESEDIGGSRAGTMGLNIGTGEVTWKHTDQGIKVL